MTRLAPAVLCAALVLPAAACGGSGSSEPAVVARVGGHAITSRELNDTVLHFAGEARREGRDFPQEGSPGYAQARRTILGLLVSRAEVEAAAAELGVHVTGQEVAARLAGASADPDATEPDRAFARATVRAQLVQEQAFRRLGRGVTVGDAEVRSYYRSHRSLYGKTPFAAVRASIRAQLLAQKRNAATSRWLAAAHRRLAPTVVYAKGYGPPP